MDHEHDTCHIVIAMIVILLLIYWLTSSFIDNFESTTMEVPDIQKTDVPILSPENIIPAENSDYSPDHLYFLDDGAEGRMSIHHNLCSKSCCSEQYPLPFKLPEDPYVMANKDKFVPSNYFCSNNAQDSGCLCLSKEQDDFLYDRGGNGRESF